MQEEFLGVVAEHRNRGATVFLSSHDLDEVQRACDRVAIIREGRLAAVEHVATLRGRSYHHVAFEFASAVDPREFARIPGVTAIRALGPRLSFRAQGDLDAIVKTAARHTVVHMELTEPTLEEVFLTFYQGEARP